MRLITVKLIVLVMSLFIPVFTSAEFDKTDILKTSPNYISESKFNYFKNENRLERKLSILSLPFISNKGQFDEEVAFIGRTFGGVVFVTKGGELIYSFPKLDVYEEYGKKDIKQVGEVVIKEKFLNNMKVSLKGTKPHEIKVNYFKGSETNKWKSGIETYEEISLGELYDKIELRLKVFGNNIEKLFYIKPYGKTDSIKIRIEGAEKIDISEKGELVLFTEFGKISYTKPIAYQLEDKKTIEVSYMKISDTEYGFRVGEYEKNKTLIIDPLLASTFIGGGYSEYIYTMKVDKSGNVYVAGFSSSSDLPATTGAFDRSHNGEDDGFVAKFNGDLNNLLALTYLGGSSIDRIVKLDLDGEGNIYVVGHTYSSDFPTTSEARYRTYNGNRDGFITKLNGNLTEIIASTYLGGSNYDYINTIKIDTSGNLYVGGITFSANFPVTSGAYDINLNGESDGFISKMRNNLKIIIASTYLGGSGYERINDIDFDSSGNVYVTGTTLSDDFPTTAGARDRTFGGASDGFISKLDSNLSSLIASTYLGGNNSDEINAIRIDRSDNIYVAGKTRSSDFPTTLLAYDRTLNGDTDGFISKFNSNLSSLLSSTYLGGSNIDQVSTLEIDGVGNLYVAGLTSSDDFPTSSSALDRIYSGGTDGFISKLDGKLSKVLASTYIGSSGYDSIDAILFDNIGNLYFAGCSNSTNFPVTSGGYDTSHNGLYDGFIAKITPALSSCTSIFSDVSCSHWAYDPIRWVKEKGITTLSGQYRPNEPVTRAQMAAFIIRALEGEPAEGSYNPNPYFSDVPTTHWAFAYIQRVKERGIASGYAGTTLYGAEDNVTREQMAKMLIMAFVSEGRITEPPDNYCDTESPFIDIETNRWSCKFIKRLRETGITRGCNPPQNDLYCPLENVNRAQMATFLYRAFDR